MKIIYYCILAYKVDPTPNLLLVHFADRDVEVLALSVLSGVYSIDEKLGGILIATFSEYADRIADILKSRRKDAQCSLGCSSNDTEGSSTGCYHCRLKLPVVAFQNKGLQQIICAG